VPARPPAILVECGLVIGVSVIDDDDDDVLMMMMMMMMT
jgi:hypothetical protein